MRFLSLTFFLILLQCSCCTAQRTDSLEGESTSEKIWKLVYDDSTRALAILFELKRMYIKDELRVVAKGTAVSSLLIATGWLLVSSGRPIVFGLVPLLSGEVALIFYCTKGIIQFIRLQRYSFRRFQRMVHDLSRGTPLPRSYLRQLVI